MSNRNYRQMGKAKVTAALEHLDLLDAEDQQKAVDRAQVLGIPVPSKRKPSVKPATAMIAGKPSDGAGEYHVSASKVPFLPEIAPMLAKAAKRVSDVNADCWACEVKFDGWRLICHRSEKDVRVWGGRNGSNYSGHLPYLEAELLNLPPDTIVDGEIVAPAGFGSVQSAMSTNAAHVPSALKPALTLHIFDVLRIDGTDVRHLPWTNRRALVECIGLDEHTTITKVLPTTQATVDEIIAGGGEGVMLKRKTARYTNGRSRDWLKIKAELTTDVRVVGFKPATPGSSWEGLCGAIEFEIIDTGVRSRCSGFDMGLREEMTADPMAFIGRVFELKFNPGVGKDGKPRSPNFLRWRPDRDEVA